ncbi:MAG: vitamin K epoxide reductase family protein [Patescibacteria group bacterium]
MTNSKHLSTALLVLSFLAFIDSAYLTIEHYRQVIPPCTLSGCEQVLTSSYSVILGVPTSLWGVLYALLVFFLVLTFRSAPSPKRASLLLQILGAGVVGSLGLVYVQWFILDAFCQYCLIFESLVGIMFIVGWYLRRVDLASWQPPGNSI